MDGGSVRALGQTAQVAQGQRIESTVRRAAHGLNQGGDAEALRRAAIDFEALFLQQLFDVMRRSIPKSDVLESSFARDTYEAMLFEELAKESAQSGGIGLADMLMEQLGRAIYDPK